jgi:hypothetical protein
LIQKIEKQLEKELQRDLWVKGEISWVLLDHQISMYEMMRKFLESDLDGGLKFVVDCSRRFGKTFTLQLIADEFCRKNPGCHVRFAAPSKTQLKQIVHPNMAKIHATCPKGLKPKWRTGDSMYLYPNKSQLHLAGCDDTESMEALRGTESHLNIVTEGGSISRLKYLLKDILIPQTLTTKGKTFIDSTPPPDPHHYYNILVDEAKKAGNYVKRTIDDNTSLSEETREAFIEEAGGRNDPTCRREYFCERTRDEDRAIITQFKPDIHVRDFQRPQAFAHFDRYMALDLGLVDKSVCIYSYYDHTTGFIHVEDEATLNGKEMTSDNLGKRIREKRNEIWNSLPIYREISDNNNLMALNDMNVKHGLNFQPTAKNTLHGMVNNLNNFFQQNRIIIHPRCVEVAGAVDSGVWDKRREKFARHPIWGHFDALAALMYLVLNLNQSRSPMPKKEYDTSNTFILSAGEAINEEFESLKRRFLWSRK